MKKLLKRTTVALGVEKKFVRDNRCGNCGGMLIAHFHPTDRELYEIYCVDGKEHTKIVKVGTRDRIRNKQAKDFQEVKNFYDPDPDRDDSADKAMEDLGY